MATRPERVVLTFDDYLELPNDRNRYELLEGELEVTPAPSPGHQRVLGRFFYLMYGHVQRQALGTVLMAPCDVRLSDITVVQPDLLFVAQQRQAIILPQYVQGPPDLVVEVVSRGTVRMDREIKRQLYARHRVPHYWVIVPERRVALAYVLDGESYRQALLVQGGETFSAAPLPDLLIPLGELWE